MERDYPLGHPAAGDYKGEKYTPPRAPFAEDFPPGHPARLGKNTSAIDTPDGVRDNSVLEWHANAERTAGAEPHEAQADTPRETMSTNAETTTFSITGEVQAT